MFWPIGSLKIGGGVGEFKVQLCLQNDQLFEIVKWLNMNTIPSIIKPSMIEGLVFSPQVNDSNAQLNIMR
jgi:hypothetical protein